MRSLRESRALAGHGVPEQVRRSMLESLAAGLEAANPATAVHAFLRCSGGTLAMGGWSAAPRRVVVVGAGKAGGAMASAVEDLVGGLVHAGVVIVKDGHRVPTRLVELCEASHPLPDGRGVEATRRLVGLARRAEKDDLLLVVLSGGGSALLTWPAEGLALADLQTTTDALLRSGATIHELNVVRRHLDRVKGGGLVRLAGPAPLLTLALSDVVGDDPAAIASGPTVADPTTFADACAVLDRYGLWSAVPAPVADLLQRGAGGGLPDTLKPGDATLARTHYVIVGGNRLAAEAVARRARELGLAGAVLTTGLQGEARQVGVQLAGLALDLAVGRGPLPLPACLVLGGEATVTVRGPGRGGRNQEAALAAAIALDGVPGVAVACLGTDGGDGPTPAAGAAADGTTIGRARGLGLDAATHLDRNDSFPFFAALGDHLTTGPTGTNVCDLYCVFVWRPETATARA